MRFANLSERQVEGGHKTIKKEHAYQSFGPVSASVRLRAQVEVDVRLSKSPSLITELLEDLARIRIGRAAGHSMVHAARLFHLHRHPVIASLLQRRQRGHKVQTTELSKRLAQALYRCDAVSTFKSFMDAANVHQRRLAKLKGIGHWQKKQHLPLSMKALAAHHLTDHVRQWQEGCFLSLPSGLSCLCPLDKTHALNEAAVLTLQDFALRFSARHACARVKRSGWALGGVQLLFC